MQDESGPHRAGIVHGFVRKHAVAKLIWVSKSPDLNPFENIWRAFRNRLKTRYRKRRRKAQSEKELIVAVNEDWEQLDLALIDKLADSLLERISAEIKAKEGTTLGELFGTYYSFM